MSVEFADAHRDDAPTLFLEGCSCGPVERRHTIDRHVNPLLSAPALEDDVVAARIDAGRAREEQGDVYCKVISVSRGAQKF